MGDEFGDVGEGGLEPGERLLLLEASGEPDSHAHKGQSRALLLLDGDLVESLLAVEGEFVVGDGAVVAEGIPDFLESDATEYLVVALVLQALGLNLLSLFAVELQLS